MRSNLIECRTITARPAVNQLATECVAGRYRARYTLRSMTRLPPREPPFDLSTAEDLEKLMPPGVPPLDLFLTLAHNPRVLRRVRKGGLLDPGSITVREREIVILRTCALCGSEYEWGVHVQFFAAVAGLSPAQIAATVTGDAAA